MRHNNELSEVARKRMPLLNNLAFRWIKGENKFPGM